MYRFRVVCVVGAVAVYLSAIVLGRPGMCAEAELIRQGKTLSQWIAQLKEKDPKKRQEALLAIRDFGPKAKAAIPAVLAALKDDDETVSSYAAGTLASLPVDADLVTELVALLKDKSPRMRNAASRVLSGNPELNQYLKQDAKARLATKGALLEAIKDSSEFVRSDAAHALSMFRDEPKVVVPVLLAALKDEKAMVRCAAVFSLGSIGSAAKPAVPVLIELLKKPEATPRPDPSDAVFLDLVRRNAAGALGRITTGSDVAVDPLCAAIDDKGLEVTEWAIAALGDIGPAAKSAIPRLTRVWKKDPEPKHQVYAAASLVLIDPKFTKSSMKFLIEALGHKENYVRHNAVDRLGWLGPVAKEALPALRKLLKDEDEILRGRAADAIRQINGDSKE